MSAPAKRILLVEDEPSLVMTISDRLRSEGYQVKSAGDADAALREIVDSAYDMAILDVMLPGRSGFDICQEVRQRGIGIPILMLTARAQVVDRVVGLKIGADDYLTKPFEMAELLARVEALLRRARMPIARAAANYMFGDVEVDFRAAEVFRGGERVPMSALEFKLLAYLVEHRGTVVTREELLDHVWGYNATPFTRTVDVHIAALRQKLEEKPSRPRFILTAHRLGYRFAG